MKASTTQIHNVLNTLDYIDIGLYESITDPRVSKIVHQETTLKEAFESIIYYKDLMIDIINDNTPLFERIVPFSIRTNLNQWLTKINQNATQIRNNPSNFNIVNQHATQFIQYVSALVQGLAPYNLDYHVKGSPNYQKKLSDVNYLIKRYKELDKKVGNVDSLHKIIQTIQNDAQSSIELVKKIQSESTTINQQINTIKSDIDNRYENVKSNYKNISEYEINAKKDIDSIETFFNQINDYQTKIDLGLKDLKNTLSENKNVLDKKIEEVEGDYKISFEKNETKVKAIVSKNESIQKDIIDILGKAIGTKLYKAFEEKATQLKYISWGWLALLIISIIILSSIGYSVVDDLIAKETALDTSFYLRITVLFPMLYAVYFFATQYKNSNRLQEEYDFKSAVSVSLHHFKEIVENSMGDKESQSFLTKSISNIFSSPTEKVFGKNTKEKDMNDKIDNAVERIVNMANTLVTKGK